MKIFLNAVKSEIQDPLNRNKVRPNLPPDELEGLKQLIDLQKNRIITIKPCDKGAGIIILNYQSYLDSCYNHLQSQQINDHGDCNPYYEKVDDGRLDVIKSEIKSVIDKH